MIQTTSTSFDGNMSSLYPVQANEIASKCISPRQKPTPDAEEFVFDCTLPVIPFCVPSELTGGLNKDVEPLERLIDLNIYPMQVEVPFVEKHLFDSYARPLVKPESVNGNKLLRTQCGLQERHNYLQLDAREN